jgi:polysaccharide export outer membrane protein
MRVLTGIILLLSLNEVMLPAQPPPESRLGYVLGPEDAIVVRVVNLDEFDPKALGVIHIDDSGQIHLPLAGHIQAAGMTVGQLEKVIAMRLSGIMKEPEVTVAVAEVRSQPVSVLGAVKNPGVYQITGRKTLFEILSLAGGLNADAGNRIKITRLAAAGRLPLPNATLDPGGGFYIGELNVRNVMEAKSPADNIDVLPNDVITVPKGDVIYVVGAVHRSGGFPLGEKEHISVLQAVSLAEGLDRVAGTKNARILRQPAPGMERKEIPVDVQKILAGRAEDLSLRANDILFIPNSVARSASMRALEAVIQAGTGVVIWGR